MPDLLGMIDQVATSEAPARRPTRRGRRRRGPSRDEVLAETRSAIDGAIPEVGGATSRDDVLAATRGAIAETMPEANQRGWGLMSPDDAFGHAEPDVDDRGGPPDDDDDDLVAPEADDVAAVPRSVARAPGMRAPLPPPTVAAHGRIAGVGPVTDFAQRMQDDDDDPMPAAERAPSFAAGAEWEPSPDDEAEQPVEMMTTEEALGPNSRYTANELDAMRRGERLDRATSGLRGGAQMLGGLLGMVGGATGRGGLSAFGLGMGEGGQNIEAGNYYDRARAAAEDRIAKTAEEERQAAELGLRERTIAVNERNAASGNANAEANRHMRELAAQREQHEYDAANNPDSPAAEHNRQRLISLVESSDPSLIGDWSDVLESIGTVGASQIQQDINDLQETLRGNRAPRRRGRGGGGPRLIVPGGGGGGGATPGDGQSVNPLETMLRAYAGELGIDPSVYIAHYNSLGRDEQERVRARMETVFAHQQDTEGRQEYAEGVVEQQSEIPGLVRSPNAPRLSQREAADARDAWVTFRNLSASALQLQRLADRIRAREAAAGRGIAGVRLVGPDLQLANQLQEQVSNALRNIGGYGVPNGTELERMERLAPRLDTLDGLLNAAGAYQALRRVMFQNTRTRLNALGYDIDRGGR